MRNPFKQRRESMLPPEPFTGNCYVREHTGDGSYVGRCHFSTYGSVCPRHGDVSQYLGSYPDIDDWFVWPRDFELAMYDGSPWAEKLREEWKGR